MNFEAVLALPKIARSAQTHKSISFIWIVWSTLYVFLCCSIVDRFFFLLKVKNISTHWKYGFLRSFTTNPVVYISDSTVICSRPLCRAAPVAQLAYNRVVIWTVKYDHRCVSCPLALVCILVHLHFNLVVSVLVSFQLG